MSDIYFQSSGIHKSEACQERGLTSPTFKSNIRAIERDHLKSIFVAAEFDLTQR
jgi:hypothetical protein